MSFQPNENNETESSELAPSGLEQSELAMSELAMSELTPSKITPIEQTLNNPKKAEHSLSSFKSRDLGLFDLVRTEDPVLASKLLRKIKGEQRDQGGWCRRIWNRGQSYFCRNFKNSCLIFDKNHFVLHWSWSKGVPCARVEKKA